MASEYGVAVASCVVGYDSSGPSLYYGRAFGVASLAKGDPAGDGSIASWILTLEAGDNRTFGAVELALGWTTGTGYVHVPIAPQFKFLAFAPARVEIFLTDPSALLGALLNPGTVLGNTGYVTVTILATGVDGGSVPA